MDWELFNVDKGVFYAPDGAGDSDADAGDAANQNADGDYLDILDEDTPGEPESVDASSDDDATADDGEPQGTGDQAQPPEKEQPLTFAGRQFANQQELEKFIHDAETWRHQSTHFQGLYEQERQRAASTQQQTLTRDEQLRQQEQQRAEVIDTPEKMVAYFNDELKMLVSKGWIDEVIVEEAPVLAANLLYYKRMIDAAFQFLGSEIVPFVGGLKRSQADQYIGSRLAIVDDTVNTMIEEGGIYSDLGKRDVQEQFAQHLQAIVQDINVLTPEFVRAQWGAFRFNDLRAAVTQEASSASREARRARAAASGTVVSARPSASQKPEGQFFDDLLDDVMPPRS